jgi:hypothetical protein
VDVAIDQSRQEYVLAHIFEGTAGRQALARKHRRDLLSPH